MPLVTSNFQPGQILSGFQQGQNTAINQRGANLKQSIVKSQEARTSARAPLLLQQDKNKLTQQRATQLLSDMKIAAVNKASLKDTTFQRLQIVAAMTDPVKQQQALASMEPQLQELFGKAIPKGTTLIGTSSPAKDQIKLISNLLAGGPNTSKTITDSQGRQFRTNRLTGKLEQVQVNNLNQNQAQTPNPTPTTTTGITIPALNGSKGQSQTFGASLGQGQNQAQPTNTLISPKLAKNQSDAANKAEQLKLNQDKNSRETVTANRKTQQAKAAKKSALALDVSNYSALDSKYNTNLSSIDNLFKSTNGLDSSVGAIKGKVSIFTSLGNKAANFQTDLDTFIANLSIDTLTQSKRDGATWGALSEKELALLTAAAANLSLNQTPESFRKNLATLRKSMSAYQRRYRFAYKKKYGKLPSRQEQGLKPLNDNNISKSDVVAMTNAAGDKIMERPNGTRYLIKAGK